MTDRDALTEALAHLDAPPLDAGFAARVGACARAELRAPATSPTTLRRARFVLVPAILSLAAVVETATTVTTIAKIYGKGPGASSE